MRCLIRELGRLRLTSGEIKLMELEMGDEPSSYTFSVRRYGDTLESIRASSLPEAIFLRGRILERGPHD